MLSEIPWKPKVTKIVAAAPLHPTSLQIPITETERYPNMCFIKNEILVAQERADKSPDMQSIVFM